MEVKLMLEIGICSIAISYSFVHLHWINFSKDSRADDRKVRCYIALCRRARTLTVVGTYVFMCVSISLVKLYIIPLFPKKMCLELLS